MGRRFRPASAEDDHTRTRSRHPNRAEPFTSRHLDPWSGGRAHTLRAMGQLATAGPHRTNGCMTAEYGSFRIILWAGEGTEP